MENIIFDIDSKTLYLKGCEEEKIQISNPAKRLLLLLLSEQGKTISRNLLLAKVWEDYGMRSSNNNLNQCISKLRLAFKTLNIQEDIIITYHKVGFALSDSCNISTLQHEKPVVKETDTTLATVPVEIQMQDIDTVTHFRDDKKIVPGLFRSILAYSEQLRVKAFAFPLMIALIGSYSLFTSNSTASDEKSLLGNMNECEVLTVNEDLANPNKWVERKSC